MNSQQELLPAIGQVREQVAKVFGQGGILLEKCISGARHIEVQFVVNQNREAFALGIRDCSIQRKKKIIEEAPLLFCQKISKNCSVNPQRILLKDLVTVVLERQKVFSMIPKRI